MWFDNTRDQETKRRQIEMFKIVNGYEDVDRKLGICSSNLKKALEPEEKKQH